MKRGHVLGIVVLLAFAGGSLLGRRAPVVNREMPKDRGSVSVLSPRANGIPALGKARRGDSLYDHELALVTTLDQADASMCRRLFLLHQHDVDLRKKIASRWATIAPLNFATFLENEGRRWLRDASMREALFLKWTEQDPEAAYQYASGFRHPDVRGEFLREVFGNLLYQDRAKLTELLGNESDRALLYVRGAFEDSLLADLPAAGVLIRDMPDSLFRIHASELVIKQWGQQDPQAALRFAQEVEPNMRDHMVALALDGWRRQDPQAVIEFMGKNPQAAGIQRGKVEAMLAKQIGADDPAAALDWVEQNLYGKPHADAIHEIIKASVDKYPNVAAQMARDLPASETKSTLLKTVAQEWFASDAVAALTWSQGITSPVERASILDGLKASPLAREQRLQIQKQLDSEGD